MSERERAVQLVMDLFFALREIGGKPTLKDLLKLAKRIRDTDPSSGTLMPSKSKIKE